VGKIGVNESVLLKPGSLSADEFNHMKSHTVIGERICRPLQQDRLILEVIRHHHERYDGKGYPDGLAGEDIPIAARIMAVVDAYDALTSDRPYRKRLSQEQAVQVLKQEAGKQFDPKIAMAFVSMLETGRLG
jgi:HD-GYP domain-containing protein (c-di-GMP phosphodiesterase class II)